MCSITVGEIPCPESAITIFTLAVRSFAQLLLLFTSPEEIRRAA
jgi:hypothetical protein